jgi:hypothetical protein
MSLRSEFCFLSCFSFVCFSLFCLFVFLSSSWFGGSYCFVAFVFRRKCADICSLFLRLCFVLVFVCFVLFCCVENPTTQKNHENCYNPEIVEKTKRRKPRTTRPRISLFCSSFLFASVCFPFVTNKPKTILHLFYLLRPLGGDELLALVFRPPERCSFPPVGRLFSPPVF